MAFGHPSSYGIINTKYLMISQEAMAFLVLWFHVTVFLEEALGRIQFLLA